MSLRDELMTVRASFGSITPANVVEAARPDESPLHSRFEWDDTTAAEKYRQVQAAELIRRVKITFTAADDTPREVRAFIAVRGEESSAGVYEPTEVVLADPFTSKLALQEFEREWRVFRLKYDHLKEFAAVIRRDVAA